MQVRATLMALFFLAFLSHVNAVHARSNQPPVISGTPASSVVARELFHFLPSARDPEGRRLTFSVRNKPQWASFSTTTGRLTGAPGVSHIGTARNIVISVSDGSHTVSLPAFSIQITSNRPAPAPRPEPAPAPPPREQTPPPPVRDQPAPGPAGNQPPLISGSPAADVIARQMYHFLPAARDPEGKRLTFSINRRPPWASFSTTTGRLMGAPGTSHVGTLRDIVISVSDGQNTVSLPPFSITVRASGQQPPAPPPAPAPKPPPPAPAPVNRPPTVSGSPPASVAVGSHYSFTPAGSDPDGDALTWSITNKPPAASFSVSTGRLSWTPTAAGSWSNIVIRATDSKGASTALPAFSIAATATPTTGSAALSWQPPTRYTDGSTLPASGIAAYRIYRGTSASSLQRIAEVDGRTIEFNVRGLPRGTHYFAVTTVTNSGAESAYSAIGSKTIR